MDWCNSVSCYSKPLMVLLGILLECKTQRNVGPKRSYYNTANIHYYIHGNMLTYYIHGNGLKT